MPATNEQSPSYQIAMLILSVCALISVAIQSATQIDPEIAQVLDHADLAICVLFFADFLHTLWRAPQKMRYLLTWGWIDLLSSIPTLDAARWVRVARIFRILRVLRALRASRILAKTVITRRAENAALATFLTIILVVTFASIAILQVEVAPNSTIKTADHALWWALSTITTVGYGDFVPVTSEGRVIASILMLAGVGLFSTFSGLLAAWFLAPKVESSHTLATLHSEIAELRQLVESLSPADSHHIKRQEPRRNNPRTHPDPRAQKPDAHVSDVNNPDGTPWLPIK